MKTPTCHLCGGTGRARLVTYDTQTTAYIDCPSCNQHVRHRLSSYKFTTEPIMDHNDPLDLEVRAHLAKDIAQQILEKVTLSAGEEFRSEGVVYRYGILVELTDLLNKGE